MKKLLDDLMSWDQEKEDRYNVAKKVRDDKVAVIQAERDKVKAEKAKLKAEAKAKQKEEQEAVPKEEGEEGEEPKEEGGEEKPAEQADDVVSTPEDPEPPINIDIEADSDDDFEPISIKEKVRQFFNVSGKTARLPEAIVNEAVRWRLERNDC